VSAPVRTSGTEKEGFGQLRKNLQGARVETYVSSVGGEKRGRDPKINLLKSIEEHRIKHWGRRRQ